VALGLGEQRDPFGRGGEGHAVAGQARIPNAIARRLTGAGRAEQHDVLATGQEVELAEVLDQRLLDRALEREVELVERLAGGEAAGVLGRQQRLGEAGWEWKVRSRQIARCKLRKKRTPSVAPAPGPSAPRLLGSPPST
jgi:hypothetical protein